MCGICGYFDPKSQYHVERSLLEKMNNTMTHRGPDSQGYYFNNNIGMAMCRLAIIDVKGGDQPVTNEDGTVVVMFNGEIYNYQEIRGELEKLGHRFSTQSDTEVIVHAYEEWQDNALNKFNGMFAISLWDESKRCLLLARDRVGKKPLYWTFSNEGILWSSEAKALLVAPWVRRSINPSALYHYFTLQYIPNPLTIFDGIYQLPAAHKLIICEEGLPHLTRWWQLSFVPKYPNNEKEIINVSRDLLRMAVERRLIAEVPLGVFLSGGIDSSVIVALMAEKISAPVKTFTIGFEEHQYSELIYAKKIAERYRTEHYEFMFTPNKLAELSESIIDAMDEPFADPAALPLYELSRQARAHVTVALCGDGGDETLAGYRLYTFDTLFRLFNSLPEFIRGKVPKAFDVIAKGFRHFNQKRYYSKIIRLGELVKISQKAPQVLWRSYFSQDEKQSLFTDNFYEALDSIDTHESILEHFYSAQAISLMDRTLYTDMVTYLPGDLLPKTDRMSMAHSLECRAPFLDVEWIEWTARLPERYKVRGMTTKWLLKRAFRDLLVPEIIHRGKHGFRVPVELWLNKDLKDWARLRLIGNTKLERWIKPESMLDLFDKQENGIINNNGKRIWALLMLAIWLDRYQ